MPDHLKDFAAAPPDNPNLQGSSTSTSNAAAPNAGDTLTQKKRRPRHRPRKDNQQANGGFSGDAPDAGDAVEASEGGQGGNGQRSRQRNRPNKRERAAAKERAVVAASGQDNQGEALTAPSSAEIRPESRGPRGPAGGRADDGVQASNVGPSRGGGRRRQINAKLTEADSPASKPRGERQQRPSRPVPPKEDTLTNRLIHSLKSPPYADCPICFNAIFPGQPIWSCAPSSEGLDLESVSDSQCCYTPFHLKCIKAWATKSVKDLAEAYRARGELDKACEWRCPGCQRKRLEVPRSYRCFCGSTTDPSPSHISTPHSCGNPCSRIRACEHPCPLSCHPGPCPPCQIMRHLDCHCGREKKVFRCVDVIGLLLSRSDAPSLAGTTLDLSCGQICRKPLACGNHFCESVCHDGPCGDCSVLESSKCYCGKSEKTLKCGEGATKDCGIRAEDGSVNRWTGSYVCDKSCGRLFDCGVHRCEKPCHPPSLDPATCPRSPTLITHCPCGKQKLVDLEGGARKDCSARIATCGGLCMKKLDGCDHVCAVPCHNGPCPPCSISVVMPCRCGSITRAMPCHEVSSSHIPIDILCEKACPALRNCGRHQCNRICCPLASVVLAQKGKGKKRAQGQPQDLDILAGDDAKWHECDLPCGKWLGCGNHKCEERDHRGPCRPCLRSSFEEMICYCGQTILEPPVPCGTRISCTFPCMRPPPPCGHPRSQHSCHEDPSPCPPCPFLTSKTCACGKSSVSNVRCSQEKVSCGTKCDKMLSCGFHRCERLCHGDECGSCTFQCGKPRKLCLPLHHGCTAQCHAPAACSEDEPCPASITLYCPCGRIKRPSVCGRSTSNPGGREASQQLKCTNECAVAKRNAKLAEALGISSDRARDGPAVTYSDTLTSFARSDPRFCVVVEKTLADFIASDKRAQLLPHMTEARRRFVNELAHVYRFDTQLVDQEPNRSVQIIRRVDTRVPKPLLSATVNSNNAPSSSSRLMTAAPSTVRANVQPSAPTSAARGWTSVVTSTAAPAVRPSAWGAGGAGAQAPRTPPPSQPTASAAATATSNNPARLVLSRKQTPLQAEEGVPDDWEND